MERKQFIEAGKVVNTHGVKGQLKIEVWLDSADFMKSFSRFFIRDKEYKVASASDYKNFLIVKFAGVDDLKAAVPLKGMTVFINREDADIPDGSYFIGDIIGAEVININGENIGILEDVIETPSSFVYKVVGEKEHLIPAVPEFILSADIDKGIITVNLIDGM